MPTPAESPIPPTSTSDDFEAVIERAIQASGVPREWLKSPAVAEIVRAYDAEQDRLMDERAAEVHDAMLAVFERVFGVSDKRPLAPHLYRILPPYQTCGFCGTETGSDGDAADKYGNPVCDECVAGMTGEEAAGLLMEETL